MARFERVALVAALAATLGACNLIAGLGSFQDVPGDAGTDGSYDAISGDVDALTDVFGAAIQDAGPSPDADAAADVSADADSASPRDASDAEASAAPPPADGATSPDYRWARWNMPNGAEAGLPHPATYAPSDAGVILDQVTGLLWGNVQAGIAAFDVGDGGTGDGGAAGACQFPWRLPTRIELVSILDTSQSSIRVNPIFPAVFPNFHSDTYWTASVWGDAGSPYYRWTVSFSDGTIGHSETGSAVICVQSDGGAP